MQIQFHLALAFRRVIGLCVIIIWVATSTVAEAQGGLPLVSGGSQNGQSSDRASSVLGIITGGESANAAAAETGTIPAASTANRAPLPESRLEQIFSTRAGVRMQQFGYEQLGRPSSVTVPLIGAMSDDYVLGPGDQIIVSLRGQENGEYRANVDRNGQATLPRINPIAATGRTFGSFRADLEAAVHRLSLIHI